MASESDRAFSETPKKHLKTDGISETDRASKRLKNCEICLERISKLHNGIIIVNVCSLAII